ncbi:MAG: glycosyltransferase family 4 protein [Candidatus Wallbacteria bacterium]|nr:glycosyltransferase family 4 protein [Candidatus Wallbacteria bacterium]
MIKVLQALPSLDQGGVEHFVVSVVPRLKSYGVDSTVVSAGGELIQEIERSGVRHVTMDIKSKSVRTLLRIRDLRILIKRERFDLVHAHSRVPGWLLYFASMGLCPFVFSPHGQYRNHLGSSVVRLAPHLIVGAHFVQRYFQGFGIPEERFLMAPYGIDTGLFEPASAGKTGFVPAIGAAGRLSSVKGFDVLIQALSALKAEGHDFKARIAGSGDDEEKLKRMSSDHGLDGILSFCGPVSNMREFYRSIDLLVISSRREGLPLVLLEAMSCGLPAVGTTVGDIPLVIEEGRSGMLAAPDDAMALAGALRGMLARRNEWQAMGERGREFIRQQHDLSLTVKSLAEAYRLIL